GRCPPGRGARGDSVHLEDKWGGVTCLAGNGQVVGGRQCPPCSRRPAPLRRPLPPPMTKTRTAGSVSTALSTPRNQRSNQRKRRIQKSGARLSSSVAAGPKSTSPA